MNKYTEVGNLISRGPRPSAEDFPYIKDTFASTLSLEGLEEDAKEVNELAPVRVFVYPIVFSEIYIPWCALSVRDLNAVLDIIIASAPKPLLIHCQHGQDRTGLVVAAYRVQVWGWTKEQAMKEALSFGYRSWLNYGLNQTWRQFPAS